MRTYPIKSLAERLNGMVGTGMGCHEWLGHKNTDGYGVLRHRSNGKLLNLRAHRVVWELANGPLDEGACLLHRCDNRGCCRLDHLMIGDRPANNADRQQKGRTARGEDHGWAVLTEQIVGELRQRYASGAVSYRELAEEYGLNPSHVFRVVTRRLWRHV